LVSSTHIASSVGAAAAAVGDVQLPDTFWMSSLLHQRNLEVLKHDTTYLKRRFKTHSKIYSKKSKNQSKNQKIKIA
jgi:hypothetical protein